MSLCEASSRYPSNNRALEYTNRHSIRAVDRGSYRNLLCSREVAREGRAGKERNEGGETGRDESAGRREGGGARRARERERAGGGKRLDEWRRCCWW